MTQQFSNLEESMGAIDTDLDQIAAGLNAQVTVIEELKAQIAGGLTADEAEAVNARLDALQTETRQIAAVFDPAVPPDQVPPTEETPA